MRSCCRRKKLAELALAQDDARIYDGHTNAAEIELAQRISWMAAQVNVGGAVDDEEMAVIDSRLPFNLSEGQRRAIELIGNSRLAVLTGGPGTGKTTIIRAIYELAKLRKWTVGAAAPTGRAAKRMQESTGIASKTIHRLLEFDAHSRFFGRSADRPLEFDVVIVDESSMLDQQLALEFFRAIAPQTSVILVGDVDQLPSVGAGNVLDDVIQSGAVPVGRLRRIFRQADESRIVDFAHSVLQGELIESSKDPKGDFFILPCTEPDDIVAKVVRLVTERIPAAFGLDARRDVQVLVPMHGGPVGTVALNAALQKALDVHGPGIAKGERRIHVGDKVMQLKNDYDLETYNGDIGIVVELDATKPRVVVDFAGRMVTYETDHIDGLDLAYAVTVHKSQGSEFPAVVLVLSTHHFKMLQRNLLYTAVTRARQRLVIVGNPRAIRMAADDIQGSRRFTGLREKIVALSEQHQD